MNTNSLNIANILNYQKKFEKFCEWGLLEDAHNLFQNYKNINISNDNEYPFCSACRNGHLGVAKWLLLVKPTINISVFYECPFLKACGNGRLDVAKWLLLVKPTIDISVWNEYAFRCACGNGHLAVAQWLISVKPTIDISAEKECAFRYSCINNYLEMAKWLQSLKPEKYCLTIENGKLIDWEVRVSLPNHPSKTLSLQDVSEEDRICIICQEHQVELQTNCSHNYCKECIQKWYNADRTNCPYCRQNITEFVRITTYIKMKYKM